MERPGAAGEGLNTFNTYKNKEIAGALSYYYGSGPSPHSRAHSRTVLFCCYLYLFLPTHIMVGHMHNNSCLLRHAKCVLAWPT